MSDPDDPRAVADALGPAVAPVGGDELLRALTDTARQLFGARSTALTSDGASYATQHAGEETAFRAASATGEDDDVSDHRMRSANGETGIDDGMPSIVR